MSQQRATAFIIPFDLGVHSYIDHLDGHPRLASPHGWAAGYFLINAAKDKKLWYDHTIYTCSNNISHIYDPFTWEHIHQNLYTHINKHTFPVY